MIHPSPGFPTTRRVLATVLSCLTVLATWALRPAPAVSAPPVQAPHLEVELVSAATSVQPGTVTRVGLKFVIDEHWHVYWECCGPHADDALWARSQPLDFEGVTTRRLAPADQLLHVCVHASRRANRPQLLWIPDALVVMRAGGVEWPRLLEQARESDASVARRAAEAEYAGEADPYRRRDEDEAEPS